MYARDCHTGSLYAFEALEFLVNGPAADMGYLLSGVALAMIREAHVSASLVVPCVILLRRVDDQRVEVESHRVAQFKESVDYSDICREFRSGYLSPFHGPAW